MPQHPVYAMAFAKQYPLYAQKAERKQRTQAEIDQIVCWLTGYDREGMRREIAAGTDIQTFFAKAPAMHPNRSLVKGVVCGVRVETVEEPLMQELRRLDKLVDELAKGKPLDPILRR